jgi:HAD superfamily hydrolase (TIGR01459 family)
MSKSKKYTSIVKIPDLINNYDLFLFDIWGVVLEGDTVYKEALEAVNYLVPRKKVMFISNSPRTKESTTLKLKNLGFNINDTMVITAGELAKNFLQYPEKYFGIANPSIYNFGLSHNQELWQSNQLSSATNIENADLIVISLSVPQADILPHHYELLEKAAKLGLPAICSNNDRIAAFNGQITYCAGHFAEKFEEFGGKVFYMGKPFEPIFLEAFKMHPEIDKNRTLMIGDTINTDILGANNAGIHSALVTTGNLGLSFHKIKDKTEKLLLIEKLCSDQNSFANHIINLSL